MAVKKSQLYSSLWKSCDELRGGMDASQYKDYVLTLLFVKYVSDKYAGQPDSLIEIPEGGSFDDMVALKGNAEIGDRMNKIIGRLAGANDLLGIIDQADFNAADKLGNGQEMVDRLSNLIAIFQNPNLDFSRNRAEGDDLLGDAYEYLMRHFATESGKSKGQFYTPAEVSMVIANVVGVGSATSQAQTIYDPTCGSGSLLLKAHDQSPVDVSIYGQEKDVATCAMARMNMFLHNCPTAEIWNGNTLSEPHFKDSDGSLKTFDFVVANPPFSDKAWSNGLNPVEDKYRRFTHGIPPEKNGDFAFLLHLLASMKSTGKGAIILPHGVLFRGNAEADIRRNLIRQGVIKGIIGLPPNLFFGTGIPACIVVLDKEGAGDRTDIFMIDASKGFMKDGNKNRLRHQDIHKIVDAFTRQFELPKYSRVVPVEEIEQNDFNLNIPRYIDSSEPEDLQDIEAHLKGGIPDRDVEGLAEYWSVCPTLKGALFGPGDRPGYSQLKVRPAEIRSTINAHPEFIAFKETVQGVFDRWQGTHVPALTGITVGDSPNELIQSLSESLLAAFADAPLVEPYDLYQHLMTYWSDTMQDDVYLITSDGWRDAARLRLIIEEKKAKGDKGQKNETEKADLVVGKRKLVADLIPPLLIVARFFAVDQARIDAIEAEMAAATAAMDEMKEEHGGEEGLLYDAMDDAGKLSKATLSARLREVRRDSEAGEERALLESYLGLMKKEGGLKKDLKEAQGALATRVEARYAGLSESEIVALVVEDKWLAALAAGVQAEVDRASQTLTGRVRQLAERYATPLSALEDEVSELSAKVEEHLKKMGFEI